MLLHRFTAFIASIAVSGSIASAQVETTNDSLEIAGQVEALGRSGNPVVQVSAGSIHACALVRSGRVYCWGSNFQGQLGNGDRPTNSSRPVRVRNLSNVTQITAGSGHTCALRNDGIVFCWGNNANGQLGDGSFFDDDTRVRVTNGRNAAQISAGADHTCMVKRNGRAFCWGRNFDGQLGIGENLPRSYNTPQRVIGGISFTQISAGVEHTCATADDGRAYCWGANGFGGEYLLGVGSENIKETAPKRVRKLKRLTKVVAGLEQSCALRRDGVVFCWGANESGQLGDGTTEHRNLATRVKRLFDAQDITVGSLHSCAARQNGNLACWGRNSFGQLGDGTETTRLFRERVLGLSNMTEVSAGNLHTCGLRHDGKVFCWGWNSNGQLGNGETNQIPNPFRVRARVPQR